MADNTIAILMATYNGEKYLREQIDSILSQTYRDWHLFIHDDGSEDGTIVILKEYKDKHPTRITIMDYPLQGGACRNFLGMLERVEADYYMFCDQDDVWLPKKIEMSLRAMYEMEKEYKGIPIIVNTDLMVVDNNLGMIAHSFWEYEGIYPEFIRGYYDNAAVNSVTGCTMLFNSKVKELMPNPSKNTLMHDTWLTLSTYANYGKVVYLQERTVNYRQHGSNVLGARDISKNSIIHRMKNFSTILKKNSQHFLQMNDVKHISLLKYIIAKLRYRKFICLQSV